MNVNRYGSGPIITNSDCNAKYLSAPRIRTYYDGNPIGSELFCYDLDNINQNCIVSNVTRYRYNVRVYMKYCPNIIHYYPLTFLPQGDEGGPVVSNFAGTPTLLGIIVGNQHNCIDPLK